MVESMDPGWRRAMSRREVGQGESGGQRAVKREPPQVLQLHHRQPDGSPTAIAEEAGLQQLCKPGAPGG